MQNFDEAMADFKHVLDISPENASAKKQIKIVQHKTSQQKEKEKKLYSNMFAKFAQIDSKVSVAVIYFFFNQYSSY